MSTYRIYGAYHWTNKFNSNTDNEILLKNHATPVVMKEIVSRVEKYAKQVLSDNKIKIQYNRLRASAGGFIFDTISNRIRKADAIIFDITECNPNVMLELGIALEVNRNSEASKIFLIHEGDDFSKIKIPSDLQGFYLSLYTFQNGKVILKDAQSIVMRLTSEIMEKNNLSYYEDENI
jgi:hypothetical protein